MSPLFVGGRRILGSLSSDPSTGLAAGDQYYNTTDKTLKFYNGTEWRVITSGFEDGSAENPYTSVANAYADGTSNGMVYFINPNVNNGNSFQLRYASDGSRGWVETLISTSNSIDTPWNDWLDVTPTRPVMQDFNLSNGGLNYSSGTSSFVKLHSTFNLVNFAVTSKSSVTGNGITATGENEGGILPLIASDDLSGAGAATLRVALAQYFGGYGEGLTAGGASNEDHDAHWSKSGSGGVPSGPFEIHLSYRDGTKTTEEWHIADGMTNPGTTYAPNIGYRNVAQAYAGANVGSWSDNSTGKSSTYLIDASNVLSCWVSDSA